MSEYQYYEWQTVDRLLTREEQAAVDSLSSHIEVSSIRAVVTYNWGDFKYDPEEVLLDYFDAHFYQANWGTLRLMFRFPRGLLEEADIEPYCIYEYISFERRGQYQVLDLNFSPEDSDWLETEGELSGFIRLRADLLEGDYRLLYLAWLKAVTFYDYPDDDDDPDSPDYDREPPVPPGLKKLTPALQNFIRVFDLDPFLVQAAAEASPDLKPALALDYSHLIARLPRSDCDDFLARLAEGDPGVGLALRKRLSAFQPPQERPSSGEARSLGQLFQRARQLEVAEEKRQAEAARQRHIAEMKALAGREVETWQRVEYLLDHGSKSASTYDEATGLLEKLKQLSEFQDTRDAFSSRLRRLADKYASRPSLMGRWQEKGWI